MVHVCEISFIDLGSINIFLYLPVESARQESLSPVDDEDDLFDDVFEGDELVTVGILVAVLLAGCILLNRLQPP